MREIKRRNVTRVSIRVGKITHPMNADIKTAHAIFRN